LLKTAAAEFETLLAKGQRSVDAYYFLDLIYGRLGDRPRQQTLAREFASDRQQLGWKVDEEVLSPEELAAMRGQLAVQPRGPVVGRELPPISFGYAVGSVPQVLDKFALVVGETGGPSEGEGMSFAEQDARTVRDALVNDAGYSPSNVVGLSNGTAKQVLEAARKLADLVPQDGVVTIYFVGTGLNIDGRDYLAGSDATSPGDVPRLIAKSDLLNLFLVRGARVFSFFETNRPTTNGCFFGSEPLPSGSVSQMQATVPDSLVTSIHFNGHVVGLFAQAFADVLGELRSNRIPIYEFGWQVFNKMRRGNTGTTSGASKQVPTLPVLNNLASDARF
jgi:hypothetical protein